MEQRLYDESAYSREWRTTVTGIAPKDGKFHVTLAATAFYPEGGGQTADRGTLGGIPVEHVYEEDGSIYHVLPAPPREKEVSCQLDWARRFDHMQQHTGQHLLSYVFEQILHADTSSFHMGDEDVSIELSLPEIAPGALQEVEDRTNELICRNLPVRTHVIAPEDAGRFPGIKAPPGAGTIRVVEIETLELNACCGTHVSRLGEIGIVKVLRTEKMGGAQTRAYFRCGRRALADYRRKQEIVATLGRQYKAGDADLVERVGGQAAQLKAARKEIEELQERLLGLEAAAIAGEAAAGPAPGKLIRKEYADRPFAQLNFLAKHILDRGDFVVILASVPDRRLLLACGPGAALDCGRLFKEQLARFNGRGGGSARFASAGFADLEEMRRFEAFLAGEAGQ